MKFVLKVENEKEKTICSASYAPMIGQKIKRESDVVEVVAHEHTITELFHVLIVKCVIVENDWTE